MVCRFPSISQHHSPTKVAFLTDLHKDSSEDRASQATVEIDWSTEEERALRRKLDLRVLLPCFLVYFFAYLGQFQSAKVAI